MRLLRSARAGIAVACASTLAAATLAPIASTASSSSAGAEAAPLQSISIKVAKKAITVRGAKGLDAGRIEVSVTGRGVAEIMLFDRGYDEQDFRKDLGKFEQKNDIKALKRFLKNTEILGGVQPGSTGTIVLPKAGDYTVFSFGSRGLGRFSAAAGKSSPAPKHDAKIVGRTGPTWGGSSSLPKKGTLLFKNADKTVPHFVLMQQVAEGTTTDQVLEFFMSEAQGPPPEWFLPGNLETGSLSPGRSMTVDYKLPPGQYVLVCFFPDPNMQGMPHAFMGMIEMVTVG
ncbi:cupredoxin domain-containing protein [Nocardioides sediminis]|uniref:hypothetical protein n=1 Tax=Nocardioides sediminis TaxID=433648 RepID=UPI000D30EF79|nr:hypothetical protein [Nocardioides sediminis]